MQQCRLGVVALWMNWSCSVLGVVIGSRWRDVVAFRDFLFCIINPFPTAKVVRLRGEAVVTHRGEMQ